MRKFSVIIPFDIITNLLIFVKILKFKYGWKLLWNLTTRHMSVLRNKDNRRWLFIIYYSLLLPIHYQTGYCVVQMKYSYLNVKNAKSQGRAMNNIWLNKFSPMVVTMSYNKVHWLSLKHQFIKTETARRPKWK